ncbi:MAG: polyprenyl synthetase family protein, partial [Candidatus Tectomicrobia bacterium]|nr:polyprenyl synthetase family protein [Candidatus Tectomicrobia bacterium]
YNLDVREGDYLDIIHRKTGALIAASCQVGGYLGDARPAALGALHHFGMQVGYAFQLVDDALDYAGDEGRTGKEVGKDLGEGNVTLPLIRVCALAAPPERERLREIVVRSGAVGPEGLADVLGMMAKYKAVPYTLDRARGYVEAGKAALSAFPDSVHVDALRALADYVVDRDT